MGPDRPTFRLRGEGIAGQLKSSLAYILTPGRAAKHGKPISTMPTILLVILVLLLIGALPAWPYSTGWGYYPSGGLGLILLIVLVLALARR